MVWQKWLQFQWQTKKEAFYKDFQSVCILIYVFMGDQLLDGWFIMKKKGKLWWYDVENLSVVVRFFLLRSQVTWNEAFDAVCHLISLWSHNVIMQYNFVTDEWKLSSVFAFPLRFLCLWRNKRCSKRLHYVAKISFLEKHAQSKPHDSWSFWGIGQTRYKPCMKFLCTSCARFIRSPSRIRRSQR